MITKQRIKELRNETMRLNAPTAMLFAAAIQKIWRESHKEELIRMGMLDYSIPVKPQPDSGSVSEPFRAMTPEFWRKEKRERPKWMPERTFERVARSTSIEACCAARMDYCDGCPKKGWRQDDDD